MKVGMSCLLCVRVCVVVIFICPCFLYNWHLCYWVSMWIREELNLIVTTVLTGSTLHPPQVGAAGWTYTEGNNGESCQMSLIFTFALNQICIFLLLLFWGLYRDILKQLRAGSLKTQTVYLEPVKQPSVVHTRTKDKACANRTWRGDPSTFSYPVAGEAVGNTMCIRDPRICPLINIYLLFNFIVFLIYLFMYLVLDLRFSQRRLWRVLSSGNSRSVVWQKFIDIFLPVARLTLRMGKLQLDYTTSHLRK
jgi:hypothetical protein